MLLFVVLELIHCFIVDALELLFIFGINLLLDGSPLVLLVWPLFMLLQRLPHNNNSRASNWLLSYDLLLNSLLWSSLPSYSWWTSCDRSFIQIQWIVKIEWFLHSLLLFNIVDLLCWCAISIKQLLCLPWSIPFVVLLVSIIISLLVIILLQICVVVVLVVRLSGLFAKDYLLYWLFDNLNNLSGWLLLNNLDVLRLSWLLD